MAAAALPGRGLGVAVKIDDGAGRAAEIALAAVIAQLLDSPTSPLGRVLADRSRRSLSNWQGTVVGEIRSGS
jgi:L-asparaginase II